MIVGAGKEWNMKIKKELVKREIGGDIILVPVGRTVYASNGLFILNELGGFIWDLLPQVGAEEEILEAVLAEYDVPREQARADIAELLEQMRELGMI